MTTNQLIIATMAAHMRISADSGMGRLTRGHLFSALTHAGFSGSWTQIEDRAWAWIALCDRAREAQLFARQREHLALLATVKPPVIGAVS